MLFGRKKRRIVRLLVVEDEPLVAFDTEHFLSDADFEIVSTVDRVAAAVALINMGTPIDLVLVDMTLADGSGVEVARAANAAGIAVLFVTGSVPVGVEKLAHGCLSKPYLPRDLIASIAAVEAVLDGKRMRRIPNGLRLFDRTN